MVIAGGNIVSEMVFFNPLEDKRRTGFCVYIVYYPDWRSGYVV
jgi:hypothetical protein